MNLDNNIGIYIHIPFCASRCYYCDFSSNVGQDEKIEKYIDAICKELLQNAEILSERKISTVYFGGGTPSYIDSKYIEKIMSIINMFESDIDEITIEINPGTIDKNKLLTYKNCGINRLSIGLQSTYNDVLKNIGRIHTYEDFIITLELAKEIGFNNISLDLIYPLPNLSLERFKESINTVVKLKELYNIKHISVYNLELHENSKLKFLIDNGFLSLVNEDEEYEMKKYLESILEKNGFLRYEISNFALRGFESKHNLNYWLQGEYIGVGAAASSFLAGSRYTNSKDLDKYTNSINENKSVIIEKEDLDFLELMKEYVILRLRLNEGVNIAKFKKRFGVSIYEIFKDEIEKLLEEGLIVSKNDCLLLSERGKEVANIVWEEFI